MKKPPLSVLLIAGLMCAAAIIAVVVSLSLFAPGSVLDPIWKLKPATRAAFATHARSAATLLLVVGLVAAAAGFGLARGRRWAWLLSIAIFGVHAMGDVASLALTRQWLNAVSGILIDGLFLFLLLRRNIVAYFMRGV